MIALTPQLGELVTKTAQVPDLETAVWKVLSEYLELKTKALQAQIAQFEQKWDVSFDGFARKCQDNSLGVDPYSREVEQDYWAWEQSVTLLKHYQTLEAS
ncbi:MAG TPA: hypothetical protein G4N96_08105 [Chloroflexi bacterium]|nr:hypothetical protein [Chloroflexota bacterium]